MARRGRYPPWVEKHWHLLMLMQDHINDGASPNAAADKVAREHWREMPCKTLEACVAWLKRNQRTFVHDLNEQIELEQSERMNLARQSYEAFQELLRPPRKRA